MNSQRKNEDKGPLLLYLDAAIDEQRAGLSLGNTWLGWAQSGGDKRNAHDLHMHVQTLLWVHEYSIRDVDAVVVNNGPGSYTGLRLALSAAKGLCYAVNKPLILLNTLEIMAMELKMQVPDAAFFLPMIDARRMEVFAALYQNDLSAALKPGAYDLNAQDFIHISCGKLIACGGNGSLKYQNLMVGENIVFCKVLNRFECLLAAALARFEANEMDELAYATPFYLKAFYTTQKK